MPSVNTAFRYLLNMEGVTINCMQPSTRNNSIIRVAAIYLTVFYGAEDFYKQVASLYTWKGLSPLWTNTKEPNQDWILWLTHKLEPHIGGYTLSARAQGQSPQRTGCSAHPGPHATAPWSNPCIGQRPGVDHSAPEGSQGASEFSPKVWRFACF